MPLDGYTLNYLVRSLAPLLIGGRVDKITQPQTYIIELHIRKQNTTYHLRLDASPAQPSLVLNQDLSVQPKQAPHFCMFLRKALSSAKLLDIKTLGLERIVVFKFSQLNDIGDPVEKYLIFEIMGRHSNIIVLNQERIILESLTHVDEKMSRIREVLPTRPYIRPPQNDKLELKRILADLADLTTWRSRKLTANPNVKLYDLIMTEWQGFSPFMAKAFLAQIKANPTTKLDEISYSQLEKMKDFLFLFQNGANQPALYYSYVKNQYDFHAFSFELELMHNIAMPDLITAIQEAERKNREANEIANYKKQIATKCKQELKQGRRKEGLYRQDIQESENYLQYLQWGELITAHLHLSHTPISATQKKGIISKVQHAKNERFLRVGLLTSSTNADEGEELVDIPLIAGKTAVESAQIYYKMYAKLQEKNKQSKLRLLEIQNDMAYIQELLEAGERIENENDFLALNEEIAFALNTKKSRPKNQMQENVHHFYPGKPGKKNKWKALNKNKSKAKNPSASTAKATFLSIQLKSGHTVLIGRNNIQNEQLSLKIANKNDLWFHVKIGSGAHVILRNNGLPIDDFVISETASICAWFNLKQAEREHLRHYPSQGLKQTIVYCPASHLYKAKGAKPGHILYENYQDITVFPSEPEYQPKDN